MSTTVPFFVYVCVCVLPFSSVHPRVTAGNGPLHWTCAPSVAESVRIALNPSPRSPVSPFLDGGRMTCRRADPNPTLGSRNLFVITQTSPYESLTRPVQTDRSKQSADCRLARDTHSVRGEADLSGSFRGLSRCKRVSMGERWSEAGGAFWTTFGGCFL